MIVYQFGNQVSRNLLFTVFFVSQMMWIEPGSATCNWLVTANTYSSSSSKLYKSACKCFQSILIWLTTVEIPLLLKCVSESLNHTAERWVSLWRDISVTKQGTPPLCAVSPRRGSATTECNSRLPDYLDVNVVLALLDDVHVGVQDGLLTGSCGPAVHRTQHLHQSEERKQTFFLDELCFYWVWFNHNIEHLRVRIRRRYRTKARQEKWARVWFVLIWTLG